MSDKIIEKPDLVKRWEWRQRHVDAKVQMDWCAAIRVERAEGARGRMTGTRHYPDGTIEQFEVPKLRAS